MKKGLFLALLVAGSVFFSTDAFADVQGSTNNNADIRIPDASTVGVPASASTVTITENEIIEEVTFSIEGLAHTFVGDLVAVVRHVESGRSATLFSRILRDGTSPVPGVGDSSNFDGDYDFSDATNNMLWDEAGRGTTTYVLRNRAGDPNDVQQNPGIYRAAAGNTGAPISLNNAFAGFSTAGTWRLELSDRNSTQIGSFREFGVEFVTSAAIPEPSTVVLLLAAGCVGLTVRRKRN